MKQIISILIAVFIPLQAKLNFIQQQVLKVAYEEGCKIKVGNQHLCLTLPTIAYGESSLGVHTVGDKYDENGRLKSLYDSSLGAFQIKLSTAQKVIVYFPELREKYGYLVNPDKTSYKKYAYHYRKWKYFKGVLNNPIWIKRWKQGKGLKTYRWAKRNYEYHKRELLKLKNLAYKDIDLINKLLNDYKFSALIAGYYIKLCYMEAKRKGYSHPFRRAISRYNGGWYNKKYIQKFRRNIKIIKSLIRKYNVY